VSFVKIRKRCREGESSHNRAKEIHARVKAAGFNAGIPLDDPVLSLITVQIDREGETEVDKVHGFRFHLLRLGVIPARQSCRGKGADEKQQNRCGPTIRATAL
jgi:hypothetical protein